MTWNLPRHPHILNVFPTRAVSDCVDLRPATGSVLLGMLWILTIALPKPAMGETFQPGHVRVRSQLCDALEAFQMGQARVAFLGGSITEMKGYRPMLMDYLQKKFPECKFDFINAGIASTCSTTGAHRLRSDVFHRGPVDLIFVEFAVNDDQDAGHDKVHCIRGMEGILRQTRKLHPQAAIVVVYFVNPNMLDQLRKSLQEKGPESDSTEKLPLSMAAHEQVAQHYQVSSVLLASETAWRINNQRMTWAEYGGTHPKTSGNRLAADMCIACLESGWNAPGQNAGELPRALDPFSYDGGTWLSPTQESAKGKWKFHVPNWKDLPGQFRSRFAGMPAMTCVVPGEQISLPFEGRGIGAFVLAGPDAGRLRASVDGGEWKTVELYHRFSKGLHYPRTVMFFEELPSGPHRLTLKVAADKHPNSKGHAVRILKFAINR